MRHFDPGAPLDHFVFRETPDGGGRVRRFLGGPSSQYARLAELVPDAFLHVVELQVDVRGLIELSSGVGEKLADAFALPSVSHLVVTTGRRPSERLRHAPEELRVHSPILQLPSLRSIHFRSIDNSSLHDEGLAVEYVSPACITDFQTILGCKSPAVRLENIELTAYPEWKETLALRGIHSFADIRKIWSAR